MQFSPVFGHSKVQAENIIILNARGVTIKNFIGVYVENIHVAKGPEDRSYHVNHE